MGDAGVGKDSSTERVRRNAKTPRTGASDRSRDRTGRGAVKHSRDDVLARERARERAAREDW